MEEICKGCNKDARKYKGDSPFNISYDTREAKALFNRSFPNSDYKFKARSSMKDDSEETLTLLCYQCYVRHQSLKEYWLDKVESQINKEHGKDAPLDVKEQFLRKSFDKVIERYL